MKKLKFYTFYSSTVFRAVVPHTSAHQFQIHVVSLAICLNFFFSAFCIIFYSHVIFSSLSSVSCLEEAKNKPELQAQVLSRAGDWVPAVRDWMIDLLKKGLGERIELIGFQPSAVKEVSILDISLVV